MFGKRARDSEAQTGARGSLGLTASRVLDRLRPTRSTLCRVLRTRSCRVAHLEVGVRAGLDLPASGFYIGGGRQSPSSSGLGRPPLTLETGVGLPFGGPVSLPNS